MRKAKLTADEIDGYLTRVAKLPLPGDGAEQLAARLRPWAERDDGKPTYMLNLNRYFAELRPYPGAPELHTTPVATPVEAHGHYHRRLAWKWLRSGSYPIFTTTTQGEPLVQAQPGQERWDNVWIVRYPSRGGSSSFSRGPATQSPSRTSPWRSNTTSCHSRAT
jgi:hypothetical protein